MFECSLTTEKERKQILDIAKPSRSDFFSYQNLNLAYGVRNREKYYFLTLIYYMSDCIKRCDEPDNYTYVLLHNNGAYKIYCQSGRGIEGLRVYKGECSFISEGELLEAIQCYNKIDSFEKLENQQDESLNGKSLREINNEYIKKLIPEAKQDCNQTSTQPKANIPCREGRIRKNFWLALGIFTGIMGVLCLLLHFFSKDKSSNGFAAGVYLIIVSIISILIYFSKIQKQNTAREKWLPKEQGKTIQEEAKDDYSFITNIGDEIEKKNKREYREALERLGFTEDRINELKRNAKRDEKGNLIIDRSKPDGSIENPCVVGMPECSNTLVFDWRNNRWLLTDGLGNGWIR